MGQPKLRMLRSLFALRQLSCKVLQNFCKGRRSRKQKLILQDLARFLVHLARFSQDLARLLFSAKILHGLARLTFVLV